MRMIRGEDDLLPQGHPVEDAVEGTATEGAAGDLQVVPNDNPPEGRFGFLVIDPRDDNRSFLFQSDVFTPAARKDHLTRAGFTAVLREYVDLNLPVFEANEPATMRLGFLVLKGDGNEWHTIRMSLWQKT